MITIEKTLNYEILLKISGYAYIGGAKSIGNLFNTVKVMFDSIEWNNHLDLDPELLYQESIVTTQVARLKTEGF